jgi:hypothetical protein
MLKIFFLRLNILFSDYEDNELDGKCVKEIKTEHNFKNIE